VIRKVAIHPLNRVVKNQQKLKYNIRKKKRVRSPRWWSSSGRSLATAKKAPMMPEL